MYELIIKDSPTTFWYKNLVGRKFIVAKRPGKFTPVVKSGDLFGKVLVSEGYEIHTHETDKFFPPDVVLLLGKEQGSSYILRKEDVEIRRLPPPAAEVNQQQLSYGFRERS